MPTLARNRALLALVLLVPVPTISIVCAESLTQRLVGQIIWAAGKIWLCGLPLLWLLLVDRDRVS